VLVTYVDTCVACSCSSLRDEGGRRPLPGSPACSARCACHEAPPASLLRAARATAAAAANDAVRSRLFLAGRAAGRTLARPAVR
jgi:hypothetical protein